MAFFIIYLSEKKKHLNDQIKLHKYTCLFKTNKFKNIYIWWLILYSMYIYNLKKNKKWKFGYAKNKFKYFTLVVRISWNIINLFPN